MLYGLQAMISASKTTLCIIMRKMYKKMFWNKELNLSGNFLFTKNKFFMQFLYTNFAKTLIHNYGQNHYVAINTNCTSITVNPGVIDTRSIWHSLDELKQFIHEIEKITLHNSPASDLKLGVRIYLGEYPLAVEELNKYGVPTEYAGLATLVFIPTYYDEINKVDRDFDPSNFESNLMPAPMDPNKTGAMLAMNHGNEIPPPPAIAQSGCDFLIIAG